MRNKGLIVLALLILIGSVKIYASHIAGAEISYKRILGNTYLFKLKVYRDCRECKFNNSGGGDNTTNCNDVPDLIINGALGTTYATNQLGSIEINRKNIKDLTATCNSSISKCRPGSNISIGYEEHVFEGLYDFSKLINDGYCKFDISVSMSSRSININNLVSEQFFNYAMLNTCDGGQNESVEFETSPQFLYQLSQSNYHSLGVINRENDSVAFSLKPALVSRNRIITYAAGRNSDMPYTYYCLSGGSSCAPNISNAQVEGFYCSKATGDIAFTPMQINQGGVLVVECEEWKKNGSGTYYLAGVTRRDVYADIVGSNNNIPVIKNKILDYIVCEGKRLAIEINLEDIAMISQPNDSVFADFISNMTGVTLDRIPISYAPYNRYVLNIDQTINQIGKFFITVNAKDNHCPLLGRNSKTFSITVLKSRTIDISTSVKNCGMLETFSPKYSSKNFYWTIRDKQQSIIKQQFSRKTNVQLLKGGDYYIEAYLPTENGYCEVKQIDTIHVADFTMPVLNMGNDITVCQGLLVSLQPKTFTTYDTYDIFANGAALSHFPYQLKSDTARTITFRIEQKNGCNVEDKITLSLYSNLKYQKKNDTVCVNDIFPHSVKNISFDKTKVNFIDYSYSSVGSTIEKVNNLTWNLDLINYSAHKMYLYSLLQDKNLCYYMDTTFISVLEPEDITVNCPDRICINALPVNLQTKTGGKWECINYPAHVTNNILSPDYRIKTNMVLKYTENKLCVNSKTFYVQPMDTTQLTFDHDKNLQMCENSGLFELKGLPKSGDWTGDYIVQSKFFDPSSAGRKTSQVIYKYTNGASCVSRSVIKVNVEKLPALKVVADKERVCIGDVLGLQALESTNGQGYWYTSGEGKFEKPVSAVTTYVPNQNDVNKGSLIFTYTLQTNGVCGNVSSSIYISVKNGPDGKILENYPVSICEPAAITFSSNFKYLEKQYWFINDSLADEFDYNFNFSTVLKAGDYVIKTKVYDSTCEALAISKTIHILPKPLIKIVSNPSFRISREYPNLYLKDQSYSRSGHTANWYYNNVWISDSRELYYKADDSKDSFYIKLVATSNNGGCKDSSSQLFVFIPINQLYIPDAFSPDAKGPEENNKFRVHGPEMRFYEIEIFNKYGEKVYISNNMNEAWDGTYKNENCMPTVYFYKIVTTDLDGINRDYSGTVTLIR